MVITESAVPISPKLGEPCAESCSQDAYGASFCWGQPSRRDVGRCYAEDGLYCALNGMVLGPLDGSGATCVEQRAAGEACTSSRECADGACVDGVCGPGNDVGEPCPCKADLTCTGATCQPGRRVGESSDFAELSCAPGFTCRLQAAPAGQPVTTGTCECSGYYGSYAMPLVCDY